MQPSVGFSRGIRPLIAIFVLAAVPACRASAKANANVNTAEAQVDEDRRWEVPEAPAPARGTSPAAPEPAPRVASAVAPPAHNPAPSTQFYGVSHDLSLASNAPRVATCRCLAVAYGPPSDAKFAWQAGAPGGDLDAIAIAITGDGVGCDESRARASISALEREGADIVLVVENVGAGRPVMRGAIAPYPGPNGTIVVRSRHGTAYPAANGAGPCRIAMR